MNLYGYVDTVGKPPAFNTNLYIYAGDDPINGIDPYGLWTVQIGSTLSYYVTVDGVGIGGTAGVGFAIDGNGNIATYSYGGGGGALGTPGFSGGAQASVSNANTICDLAGPFRNLSLGGGWGPDATGDAFWGQGTQGQLVSGAGISLGGGLGADAFSGETNTTLGPIGHLW